MGIESKWSGEEVLPVSIEHTACNLPGKSSQVQPKCSSPIVSPFVPNFCMRALASTTHGMILFTWFMSKKYPISHPSIE